MKTIYALSLLALSSFVVPALAFADPTGPVEVYCVESPLPRSAPESLTIRARYPLGTDREGVLLAQLYSGQVEYESLDVLRVRRASSLLYITREDLRTQLEVEINTSKKPDSKGYYHAKSVLRSEGARAKKTALRCKVSSPARVVPFPGDDSASSNRPSHIVSVRRNTDAKTCAHEIEKQSDAVVLKVLSELGLVYVRVDAGSVNELKEVPCVESVERNTRLNIL